MSIDKSACPAYHFGQVSLVKDVMGAVHSANSASSCPPAHNLEIDGGPPSWWIVPMH